MEYRRVRRPNDDDGSRQPHRRANCTRTSSASDVASLAVPGGTTPGPIFDSLCAVDLDWSRVAGDADRRTLGARGQRPARTPAFCANASSPTAPRARTSYASTSTRRNPRTGIRRHRGGGRRRAAAHRRASSAWAPTCTPPRIFPGADRLAEALAPDAPAVMALRAPPARPSPHHALGPRPATAPSPDTSSSPARRSAQALERAANLTPDEAPIGRSRRTSRCTGRSDPM